jgi:hypothetical protein
MNHLKSFTGTDLVGLSLTCIDPVYDPMCVILVVLKPESSSLLKDSGSPLERLRELQK